MLDKFVEAALNIKDDSDLQNEYIVWATRFRNDVISEVTVQLERELEKSNAVKLKAKIFKTLTNMKIDV